MSPGAQTGAYRPLKRTLAHLSWWVSIVVGVADRWTPLIGPLSEHVQMQFAIPEIIRENPLHDPATNWTVHQPEGPFTAQ